MKIRTRIFLAFLIVVGVGFYKLVDWILEDLRPRYLETMEESMVDMATLLSSVASNQLATGAIDTDNLHLAFEHAQKRRFSAQIYDLTKTQTNMRVYITDRDGIVVFDSDSGRDEGEDYSKWNDVVRTMRGEYGARSTRMDPDDPTTSTLHVASPVLLEGEIVGVLTVCKPADSVTLFLETARWKIIRAGVIAAIAVVLLGLVISYWMTWPIERLTRYAKAVRDGKRVAAPRVGSGEIGALAQAFEEMRTALEGKQYVEDYVQTLTHQMKSPLSAIRGAAELLQEDMPLEQRGQFLQNLQSESARLHGLIERMLQLSALENRNELRDVEEVRVDELVVEIAAGMAPVLAEKKSDLSVTESEPVVIKAERFLVRQAIANLIQNAVEFSHPNGAISVTLRKAGGETQVTITDDGPGIPEYALERVFDRFYSLPRPATGKKSSGLGLAFVKEVAVLHGGRVSLSNRQEGGAVATLTLPEKPLHDER